MVSSKPDSNGDVRKFQIRHHKTFPHLKILSTGDLDASMRDLDTSMIRIAIEVVLVLFLVFCTMITNFWLFLRRIFAADDIEIDYLIMLYP